MSKLSHVGAGGQPKMVDVGGKAVTERTAVATARVVFPESLGRLTESGQELQTKKGPVFATAIVAGVMAAKRTHDVIPFCHPIPLEACDIEIDWAGPNEVLVTCSVRAKHKTGVEMEALHAVSVAALTIYDMCKALSHEIKILDIGLLSKSGGKSDFSAQ